MQNQFKIATDWFISQGWQAFDFQREVWQAYLSGQSGLLNAPTGSGKTYALGFGPLLEWVHAHPDFSKDAAKGLRVLWITPLKALAKDIANALQRICDDTETPWNVELRTSDTSVSRRKKQNQNSPQILITTPESLHVMLAQKNYPEFFENLKTIVVDEWHELLGTKRGVQVELALSRLRSLKSDLRIWGVSATIGNLDEALSVLVGKNHDSKKRRLIKAEMNKIIRMQTLFPKNVERFTWTGHMGVEFIDQILPIIHRAQSTLIFTNTRSQAEVWYQKLLSADWDLAGQIAVHHGSLDKSEREWVEEALHAGKLKAVVCTSSLDLGVDFRPVETVIQIGSPKGLARFFQRAGRSGHRPGAMSQIYFVPTHSLELIEASVFRDALHEKPVENRLPLSKPHDVLIQYLMTLAVSQGFEEQTTFSEIKSTASYQNLTEEEWQKILSFLTTGGTALKNYDEFCKVQVENGLYQIVKSQIALRHKMNIGTIVSEESLKICEMDGRHLGTVDESFLSKLKIGDAFWFSGKCLELIRIHQMTAFVRRIPERKAIIPRWSGSRMSLSENVSERLREKIHKAACDEAQDLEMWKVSPLLDLQRSWSALPKNDELLVEKIQTSEGYHVFFYPFEGRFIHEAMASLFAYRLSRLKPMSFTMAMNDYGFEILSDQEIAMDAEFLPWLLSSDNLNEDMKQSLNATEMAKRKFRDIARISGLIFQGYPGRSVLNRHLQASASLLFEVFKNHEPDHILMGQAYDEVFSLNLDSDRLQNALLRMRESHLVLMSPDLPTPFAFPILVDHWRERLSSERLADRIRKMQLQLEIAS